MQTDGFDTNKVLETWMSSYLSIIDKHLPIRIHRVKNDIQPGWFTPDILATIKLRDTFKSKTDVDNFTILRNKVCNMIKKNVKNHLMKGKL